jgi:hypothetical protein
MQAQLKIQGPVEIICRTSPDREARREANKPIYHECIAFGGALRFPNDKRIEGRFDHAIFLAEIAPRAINGFENRAQQIHDIKLLSLLEAAPLLQVANGKKAELAGAAK